jgi:HAD superfamily hydrolase (TIGR01662 family)
MTRQIRAIFFDLGDTLLDFGPVRVGDLFRQGARLAYEYLDGLGLSLPGWRRYWWLHWAAIRWNVLKALLLRREFNSLDVLRRCCNRLKLHLSEAQLLELCWLWYEPLHRQATVEPGLPEMLDELQARGLTVVVVSNTFVPGEVLDRHLAKADLLQRLPIRVYSCDVGSRKPHRAIFREALNRANVLPEEVMFVGDSPRADIRGSQRMGMHAVLKDPKGQHAGRSHGADHTIQRIVQVADLVDAWTCGDPDDGDTTGRSTRP